nr:RRP15 protein [Hymenolepis microstoma]
MAFAAIFDVVQKLLEETIPENVHPILALAKTDQEKKSKRNADRSSDEDGSHFSYSKSERVAWIRQCYKKPISAAGVHRPAFSDGAPPQIAKASASEIECEKARERRLKRQATQGVVALFNAVRQYQSTVDKQLDASAPLLLQKEKVITGYTASDFLDRLSAGLPGSKPKTPKTDDTNVDEPVPKRRKLSSFPETTYSVKIEKG